MISGGATVHNVSTPWGQADYHKHYIDGIDWYSTPSHGGFRLSNERLKAMHPALQQVFNPYYPNYFEEDCDWAKVAIAYPSLFDGKDYTAALMTIKSCWPGIYKQIMAGEIVSVKEF